MRLAALTAARVALLAGPVVLAFFTGGYLDVPRVWAGLGAWVLAAVGLLLTPNPVPRTLAARLALTGLGLLAAWTLASTVWAPIAGDAYHRGQLAALYAGGLLAAALLLRDRAALRWVEPAVAAGTLIVIGYALSERFLPGVLHFARSLSAQGRLEQPLTYWNAMGELAALGVVLCARLTGDASRPLWLGTTAAAAAAPLGMGLYLTVSRGALFACAAGLVALVVLAARREQLYGVLLVVAAGALASVAAAPFSGLTSLTGAHRERDGAIALVLLAALASCAALARRSLHSHGPLRLPRHAGFGALCLVGVALVLALVFGAHERRGEPLTPSARRFATLESNRYAYWRVAWRAFRAEPLRGVGAGGWAVYWRRLRTVQEGARDAHSLYFQTAAELGLVGLALLAVWLAGVALAARDAVRAAPALAAGPAAGCVVWAAHVTLDWDFQMPAATLPVIVLAGALLALAEITAPRRSAEPRD
jgi:O-antigen ligase